VSILCYHTIERGWTASLSMEPADFDAHCAWLARHRRAVTLDEATAALDRRMRLPAGMVSLTFDDGFSGLFDHALPILLRHRIPATVFLVAETLTDGERPVDWVDAPAPFPLRTLTLDEVRAMASEGIDFGSHSAVHADLTSLGPAECEDDLRRSRDLLEDLLGRRIGSLAYPRGRHDAAVREAAQRAGYRSAYSLPQGPEPVGPFAVPRVGVFGGNTLAHLRIKTSPWYPGVRRSRALAELRRIRSRQGEGQAA
jgi:peptidoglycan/xylan/chitin deacetylase (PgdA/CDA1 family)